MSIEPLPCPVCNREAGTSHESATIGCDGYAGDNLIGCDSCGIWSSFVDSWNALPRRPVRSTEPPKIVGRYIVYHPLGGAAVEYFDEDRIRLYASGTTSKTGFAGPIMEPFEEPKS